MKTIIKNKKSGWFVVTVLLVMVSFALIDCPNPKMLEAAPITIRYATFFGAEYPENWAAIMKFIEIVNERGKDKVKVEFYPSETLLKGRELFSGLMGGAAEAVTAPMVMWHGTLPISQGLSLPFTWKDRERYYKALAPSSPLVNFLNDKFGEKNLFSIFGLLENNEYLWTKGRPVRHPDDAKGLKVGTSGLIPSESVNQIGASPAAMVSGEIYLSLQRGTIDGYMGSYTTIASRKLQEQLRYMTHYPFDNFGPQQIAFRKDWWEKLPKDVRQIIEEGGRAFWETLFRESKRVTEDQINLLKKDIEFIELSPAAREAFDNKLIPMHEWWVSRKEVGEPGKKLLELIQAANK